MHLRQPLAAHAIVVDSPTLSPQRAASPLTVNPIAPTRTRKSASQFRIRKTKTSDIDAISTMLAMASTVETSNNWQHRIKCLSVKSSLEKQLHNRLNAIEEGKRTMLRYKNQYSTYYEDEECILDSETTCHLLWSNDNFRNKLKSAVLTTSERNAWDGYNFDYTPQDAGVFNHAMMTVVQHSNNNRNKVHQEVVGFCEVAWLPHPNIMKNGECIPSIVNLVTSPSHRRQGIASKLLDVALRYARTQWLNSESERLMCCSSSKNRQIGLFVHPENESALCLYRRKGFQVEDVMDDGLLFMSLSA